MTSPEPSVFTGEDGRECEQFVRSVKSYAFAQGKQRDYRWMADLASTCFDGPALRWYSSLDDDVKSDWKLLERALLKQYPAGHGEAPSGYSHMPTPSGGSSSNIESFGSFDHSSPPMSIPGVLWTPTHVSDMWSPDKAHSFTGPFPPDRGVVKVWLKKVAVGFFSRTLDEDGCCVVTKDAADAAVFEIKSVGKHVSLEVLNWDSGESAYLVLTEDTDYFTFDPAIAALTAGALWDPPDEGRLKFVNFPMSTTDMAKRLFYGKVALAIEEGDVITCVFENSFKDQIVKLTFSQSL